MGLPNEWKHMIGIFDSGFGGLSVFRAIKRELPVYNYLYLGDNARAPYGNKSEEEIYTYTTEAIEFLFKKGCRLIIIACNTASVKALRKIQKEWLIKNYPNKRVLGVVIPVAEKTIEFIKKNKKKNKIGLIGTELTINSGVYEDELKKISKNFDIYSKACPLLVPLIEESWIKRKETKMILRYYLRGLKTQKINILILACTHYPLLKKQIQEVMGGRCEVLDSPRFVANKLANYLKRHEKFEEKLVKEKKILFYTTGNKEKFKKFGEKFFKEKIKNIKQIKL